MQQNSDDEDEDADLAGVHPLHDATPDRSTGGTERKTEKEVAQSRTKFFEPASIDTPVQSVRKSSRVPKKRILDGDEDDDIDTTRRGGRKADVEPINERPDDVEDGGQEESTSDRGTENTDEEEEDVLKTKKGRIQDIYDNSRKEKERPAAPLTARQRALQEKDNDQGTSLIEFPDGLRDTQHRMFLSLSFSLEEVCSFLCDMSGFLSHIWFPVLKVGRPSCLRLIDKSREQKLP